jgi:hypothetical protein
VSYQVVGEAADWAARAEELAEKTECLFVNRTDVWGGYYQTRDDAGDFVTHQVTNPRKADRGRVLLAHAVLARHFQGACTRDIVGLHSTSPTNTCRWGAIDIDRHGDSGPSPETTLAAALHCFDRLRQREFTPLLTESNGRGGYHLRVVFRGPVPSARVFMLMRWLVADHTTLGLAHAPEVFPKQSAVAPPGRNGQYGNWLRLPGRHHTHGYWSRAWNGERWSGGNRAVDHILDLQGDDPGLIPIEALAPPRRPAGGKVVAGRGVGMVSGNATATGLSDFIRNYMARLPAGLGEGEHRDDYGYRFAALLVRDLKLSDADALTWLREWDGRNAVPKGEERLRELIQSAHAYGKHAYGSGLGAALARRKNRHAHSTISFTMEVR